jgi:predicted DsbA family dithiol-disulfide isomerase
MHVTQPVPTLEIDVVFDFVCPWCLIGKRNLAAALARFAEMRPDVDVQVRWHSQQLLPDTPPSGVPYQAFYVARLGSAEAVAARRAQVRRAGAAAGVELAFDRIAVLPNTAAAHELVAWAGEQGTAAQQSALIGRVFEAYFIHAEDIGDPYVLARCAAACGLASEGIVERLADAREGRTRPRANDLPASGVPLFVFNRSQALSGAHPPDTLLAALLQSVRT